MHGHSSAASTEGDVSMRLSSALALRSLALMGLTLLATAPARAIPLSLGVFADGVQIGSLDSTRLGCVDQADGSSHCQVTDLSYGNDSYPLVKIDEINITIDNDPVVTGVTGVTNLFSSTQQITLLFTLPIVAIPGTTLQGGSFRRTVTDNNGDGDSNNGATIAAPAGSALYTAQIDGVNTQSLYSAPFSVSAGSFLSANIPATNFGSPIPSLVGGPALTSIGILLDFTLTAFDSASFT